MTPENREGPQSIVDLLREFNARQTKRVQEELFRQAKLKEAQGVAEALGITVTIKPASGPTVIFKRDGVVYPTRERQPNRQNKTRQK